MNIMSKEIITIEAEGEHIAWKNELNSYIEELKNLESQLTEQSGSLDDKKIEHFQNQFLIQKDAIGKIKNEIKKHDFAIERGGKKPFDKLKETEVSYHESISQKIDTELKIIKELKEEFEAFIKNQ